MGNTYISDTNTDEDTSDEPEEDPPTGCQADTGTPASNAGQTQVVDDDFTNGPGKNRPFYKIRYQLF